MAEHTHEPGIPAPNTGRYEELNVLGSPTGLAIEVREGQLLPRLPRGCAWRLVARQTIAEMSVAVLRARAAEYQRMATTATTVETRDGLLRIAKRFLDIASKREHAGD